MKQYGFSPSIPMYENELANKVEVPSQAPNTTPMETVYNGAVETYGDKGISFRHGVMAGQTMGKSADESLALTENLVGHLASLPGFVLPITVDRLSRADFRAEANEKLGEFAQVVIAMAIVDFQKS